DSARVFRIDNCRSRLFVKWLEVQTSTAVKIGADSFRIAVDHDRRQAVPSQRLRRLHAAVIEFNSLTNAYRSAAQNHHRAFLTGDTARWWSFVLGLECRVVI